ncbi:MAG: chromate transporter [Tyzzerella sp.]|nr:chromate transporter [Tyzzerella sp.]
MLFKLFYTFAKIGLFTFGGGYGMIAIVQDECVEKKRWITEDEFATVLTIAESTPGPIAINCATYTGYAQGGIWGAIAATFGVVLPSFVIIFLISSFFDNLLAYPIVANAFRGIQIGVGLIIFRAGYNMFKKMKKNAFSIVILASALLIMLAINFFALNFSTIYLLIIAGLLGVIFYRIQKIREGKKVES